MIKTTASTCSAFQHRLHLPSSVWFYAPPPLLLTCPVVGLVAGVRDLGPQLQVVSRLVVRGAVGAQREHAAGEAGQVAHLPLQVAVLPLADERQAAVGLADQVALDGLEENGGRGRR